ncbi:uncharacterized protein METZ01_LOCUS500285 [marine metagenome]|uniref:Uncharacterized protein n=1 Tax=marine metagenome TaxID=408172 RepID=A0A383DSG3_9ZZZZ
MALHTGFKVETRKMNDNKEQTTAALNTLINLALQVASTQQQQVQNAANVLATALGLGPAEDAGEEAEAEEPVIVTTD